jgi:hypothetical protein
MVALLGMARRSPAEATPRGNFGQRREAAALVRHAEEAAVVRAPARHGPTT